MPDIHETHLSRKETAKVLGLHPGTLDVWRDAKKGPPATVLGRRVYYRKEALMSWLRSIEDQVSA